EVDPLVNSRVGAVDRIRGISISEHEKYIMNINDQANKNGYFSNLESYLRYGPKNGKQYSVMMNGFKQQFSKENDKVFYHGPNQPWYMIMPWNFDKCGRVFDPVDISHMPIKRIYIFCKQHTPCDFWGNRQPIKTNLNKNQDNFSKTNPAFITRKMAEKERKNNQTNSVRYR
ncbi:unnamed protein product, partial [Rotaria magnacalcarata]